MRNVFLLLFLAFFCFSVGCSNDIEKQKIEEERQLNERLKEGWLDWEPKGPAHENMPPVKR